MKKFVENLVQRMTSGYGSRWQIKLLLALFAFAIVIAVVFYTQYLVNELIEREQNLIHYYAKTYEYYSPLEDENIDNFFFFIKTIQPAISFPVILTKGNDEPLMPFEDNTLNIKFDTTQSVKERRKYIEGLIEEMGNSYDPIVITEKYEDETIVTKFYYTNSDLVKSLKYFPVIAIVIIGAFILIGYMAFSSIRRNEQSKVWVGMAKEAAHQLGTPLSSLLAWIEILKINKDQPEAIDETMTEIENDLNRMRKIATRFSKIGSMPEKSFSDVSEVIERVCVYFERRLPNLGRKVEIVRHPHERVRAEINEDLFEWVLENLLKNAAESIENKKGRVDVNMFPGHKKVYISVKDNGKGMSTQQKRQVFYPGFTTKKRGWGLGLSLVKRIIEEYHNGKVYVKDSIIGKGTTFVIELPSEKIKSTKDSNIKSASKTA